MDCPYSFLLEGCLSPEPSTERRDENPYGVEERIFLVCFDALRLRLASAACVFMD